LQGQFSGNGQSETRAAVFARQGTIDLCERLEDGFQSVFGNSNTGVLYLKTNPYTVHSLFRAEGYLDGPFFREFDGVIDQVQQALKIRSRRKLFFWAAVYGERF